MIPPRNFWLPVTEENSAGIRGNTSRKRMIFIDYLVEIRERLLQRAQKTNGNAEERIELPNYSRERRAYTKFGKVY
jgi:hypothetical protein